MKRNRNLNKTKYQFNFFHFSWILLVQTSSLGAKLHQLEKEEAKLLNENQILSSELVLQNSLTKIEEKANDLGFMKPENTLYLTGKDTVAKLP